MIFPFLDIEITESTDSELPLFKEYDWDFSRNDFKLNNGKFEIVTGAEAIKIWIYKALSIERYKYTAYSFDFGQEFTSLIGETNSIGVVKSEVERYINEALLINPYIIGISNVVIEIDGANLMLDLIVNTIYGEVSLNV